MVKKGAQTEKKMENIEYDAIAIGTGSAMNIIEAMLSRNPDLKVAVVDKDEPGGICLTRACIPTKILLYPAEIVRIIEEVGNIGIDVKIDKIDFEKIVKRMHSSIDPNIASIRKGLNSAPNIDYYSDKAEFIEPYVLKVGNKKITSKLIFLCTGSKPSIPPIKGLSKTGYHTSDSIINVKKLPESLIIVGGGYIAAEYGFFFSKMGAKTTIIGRNPQFLPQEEPEISEILRRDLEEQIKIITNHEVKKVVNEEFKTVIAVDRDSNKEINISAQEILIATGRAPNSDILKPEKGGIETNKGWIKVNDFLETSQKNVWAFGDATGKHLFKHVANYESMVVYYNALTDKKIKVDYHAVPHAVFTYPEVASVGMREKEAIEKFGKDNILIGFSKFEESAKGGAMNLNGKNYFVKIIINKETNKILGAHIVGPYASILIQEIVTLMYTDKQTYTPISDGMRIHPALSEVVGHAFYNIMEPYDYHHMLKNLLGPR